MHSKLLRHEGFPCRNTSHFFSVCIYIYICMYIDHRTGRNVVFYCLVLGLRVFELNAFG